MKTMDSRTVATDVDVELDVRGLNCPLPILRTKKALSAMASGQCIRVQATDPGAVADFAAFARHTGNAILSESSDNGNFVFVIRRK
jgi:tRNA 2-thiouridine synthesizing protein A